MRDFICNHIANWCINHCKNLWTRNFYDVCKHYSNHCLKNLVENWEIYTKEKEWN